MQRAKLTEAFLLAAHVKVIEIGDVFADGFHQLIFFRIPLLLHSRTGKDGAANQLIGRTFAHVKVKRMIAVDNLLVDFFSNLTDQLGALWTIRNMKKGCSLQNSERG
mgnify:CR=1 FL=1